MTKRSAPGETDSASSGGSSSPRASARCSSGTTSTSTAAWRCSSAASSSRPATRRAQLLASLATFGAGFGVRPLGALVFGRIGDLRRPQVHLPRHDGRRWASSTALIGFLPTYAQRRPAGAGRCSCCCACCRAWRSAASTAARRPTWPSTCPTTGAATTRASSRPRRRSASSSAGRHRRVPRRSRAEDAFKAWGWRVPFLLSFVAARGLALHPRAACASRRCSRS